MKKIYLQPATDELKLHAESLMTVDAGSDAPGGAWGAPARAGGVE